MISYWATILRNRRLIKQRIGQADWIMIHGETNLFAAIALKRLLGAKLFYALRSNGMAEAKVYQQFVSAGFKQRRKWKRQERKHHRFASTTGKHSELVCVQSSFDKFSYVNACPSATEKTIIIPGNIGLPRFKPEYALSNTSTQLEKLLYVGGFGFRKGLEYLLLAMKQLVDEGCTVNLDIVGVEDDNPELVTFIRTHKLQTRVFAHGRQENPFSFLAKSDLLVVPSLFDSFPDTVLEAMHCGTPVIGSRVGGIPDMIGREDLLFEPANPDEISRIIRKLSQQNNLYLEIREHCRLRAEEFHFDWPRAFEQAMLDAEAPKHLSVH